MARGRTTWPVNCAIPVELVDCDMVELVSNSLLTGSICTNKQTTHWLETSTRNRVQHVLTRGDRTASPWCYRGSARLHGGIAHLHSRCSMRTHWIEFGANLISRAVSMDCYRPQPTTLHGRCLHSLVVALCLLRPCACTRTCSARDRKMVHCCNNWPRVT